MNQWSLTASEVAAVAKCPLSTIRAWHNRLGLFFEGDDRKGWRRYSFAQAIGVRLLVILTERGILADAAVRLINSMAETLERAEEGYFSGNTLSWIGIARDDDPVFSPPGNTKGTLEAREITIDGGQPFDMFLDPVVICVNLRVIAMEVGAGIHAMRGTEDPYSKIGKALIQAAKDGKL